MVAMLTVGGVYLPDPVQIEVNRIGTSLLPDIIFIQHHTVVSSHLAMHVLTLLLAERCTACLTKMVLRRLRLARCSDVEVVPPDQPIAK